jgi:hypothetical protein
MHILGNSYLRLALAQDLYHEGSGAVRESNKTEKTGSFLCWSVIKPIDGILTNIKNPLFIISTVALGILATSIAFYPTVTVGLVSLICPWLFSIQPWMVQLALFITTQATILGLGVRAFGRFNDQRLMQEWRAGQIAARLPGERTV